MKFLNKLPAIGTAICLGALMFFSSCTDESDDPVTVTEIETEEEEEEEVITKGTRLDISDPNIVSDNLNISEASKEVGDMPASSDNGVLELMDYADDDDDFIGIAGGQANLYLSFATEEQSIAATGTYLQVKDADTYWDIPANSPDGLKYILLSLPSNFDEGQICINYAVYDGSGNVSNVLETCIDVHCQGAGSEHAFLYEVEEWEMISEEFFDGVDNPSNYSRVFGEEIEDEAYEYMICTNSGEDVAGRVSRKFVEKGYMTFKKDGGFKVSFIDEGQWMFVDPVEGCSISELTQNIYELEGSWTYYSTNPLSEGFLVPSLDRWGWKSDTQDFTESYPGSVDEFWSLTIISYEDGILTLTTEDENSYKFDNEYSTIKLRAKQ